ncbi:malonate--CoA ligase [Pseudooceanicola aestuarii]|uniref:malonate--CoA ligase n=1 Tax=Pseudooceanicola aestuarii TaxID=2697319 RepID=UPI0013D2AFFF|nr:malonyl-CoA synthase [Pseudooceanicola aestuarii]
MANPLFDTLFAPLATRATPFLTMADGTVLTGRDFLVLAQAQAGVLVEAGLTPGDRLAAQVEKSPEALALYAACVLTGVVFLPLNTGYQADELEYFITDSGARLVVCDPRAEGRLRAIAPDATVLTLDAAGQGSLSTRAAGRTDPVSPADRAEDDLAALLYTSGTTGRSKGAMLSQGNLLSNALVLADLWKFTADDVLLHALPIFHTHGLFVATNTVLASGGAMIFLPKFDLDQVLGLLPQATSMMGVPTFYTRLLSDARFDRDVVARMRLFTSGSAPLLAETHRAFEDRTGHRILERYGMTETNMNTSNPYDGDRRAGTVGLPMPGVELKITDADSGAELLQGEAGIIEVRGANVFQGYWQMPEKTAAELREDGFFITGDIGRVDADGYVHIVGRAKDLIISGGYNIYPKEVELILDEQDGVLESAVIGVPHPDFGEGVVAILVAAPGATPDLQAIRADVAGRLARFKQPKHYEIVPELPRNTMGKVQKNVLRDDWGDVFK